MSQVIEESPLEAGREAAARHAWRDAYELLNRADESDHLTADDLAMLGESGWWLGRLEESISARERAYSAYLDEGDHRAAAVMAFTLANDHFGKLAHSMGAGWLNKAERLLENDPDCAERGWLSVMHARSALQMGDHSAGLEAADATLEVGMRFSDRDLQAFGLALKGQALIGLGDVQQGLALLDEATVAAVSGELRPHSTGVIYCLAISTTTELTDYRRAGEWTEASTRWCERQSIAGFPGVCRVHRAEIMRLRGAWAEAEQEARRALTELQPFNLVYAAEGFYELGEVRLRTGDLAGAEDAFRQANELGRSPQPGLALMRLAEGKVSAARSAIKRALENPSGDRLYRMRLLPGQVEIALSEGDFETARSAVEEMEELGKVYDSHVLQASTLCARGALELAEGKAADAIKILNQAHRTWKEADLPYESARARLLLGIAYRADGDEDAAELEISAAKAAFEKLGALLDYRRALELLGHEVAEDLPKVSVPAARVSKTFMFTDIVGSTNLATVMGDEAWSNVLAWHGDTLRRLISAHRGEEVKQIGDGFFVAFDEPLDAVECAVDIQNRLAAHRKDAGFAPSVRIGLHRVEATRKGNDYEGIGVHEAARIGALAEGGEILASKDVVLGARVRFPASEFRSVELKGVAHAVEVATITPE